jgi:putative transcriptional regulator
MLVYDKLWETMRKKGITQYMLIHQYGISAGQLHRLRKNQNVNTHTLDKLCGILGCGVEDVVEYCRDGVKGEI